MSRRNACDRRNETTPETQGVMLSGASGDHLRIVAVIEVRTGPSRQSKKPLRRIAGQPLLMHLVERLRQSQFIEEIAFATSSNPRDDTIANFGRENGITVVRGPEDDVLVGFARAAELLDADIIVRVSSETLIVDTGLADHLIVSLLEQDGDYVLPDEAEETAHECMEPFTRRALDKLMMDAHDDIVARALVTGYLKLHPDFVRVVRAPVYQRRLLADAPVIETCEKFAFTEMTQERMLSAHPPLTEPGDCLESRRGPRRAHSRTKRTSGLVPAERALIRCDAREKFGFGRVKRMVALARSLRDDRGIVATFVVSGPSEALKLVRAAGFIGRLLEDQHGCGAISAMIASQRPALLICDMCEGLSGQDFAHLARQVAVAAVIDDHSDRRLAADVAYYPPTPQAIALEWAHTRCVSRIGWEWSLFGVRVSAPARHCNMPRPTLLITMAGIDSHDLTLRVARALARLDPVFRARFVIGAGMRNPVGVARAIVTLAAHFETLEGADDLATEYAASDLALATFGATAYELAAYGVPALYLCLMDDHAKSACAFEDAGMGLSLGLAEQANDSDIARATWSLLIDSQRRRAMRAAVLATVDDQGAALIAEDLACALRTRLPGRASC